VVISISSFLQLFFSYFVGSIPTGWLVARAKGIKNIREHGSGNIGATNVARLLGPRYFFLIFFLDCFKAYGCLWLIDYPEISWWILVCAFAVLLGNSRSVFLGLKGGKGVATTVGLLLFLFPSTLLIALPAWILVLVVTKNVGIASVVSLATLPVAGFFFGGNMHALLFLLLVALWCIFLHRDNIAAFLKKR